MEKQITNTAEVNPVLTVTLASGNSYELPDVEQVQNVIKVNPDQVDIIPNDNTRSEGFEYESLIPSLKKDGQEQPIALYVNSETGLYNVEFGFRRAMALKKMYETDKKVRILATLIDTPTDEKQRLRHNLIENFQRKGLSPIEEASAIDRAEAEGMSRKEISAIMNHPQSWLSQRTSLLKLIEGLQAAVHIGEIGPDIGYELSRRPQAEQEEYLKQHLAGHTLNRKNIRDGNTDAAANAAGDEGDGNTDQANKSVEKVKILSNKKLLRIFTTAIEDEKKPLPPTASVVLGMVSKLVNGKLQEATFLNKMRALFASELEGTGTAPSPTAEAAPAKTTVKSIKSKKATPSAEKPASGEPAEG
jgi:ParB/RepB/Spo0J family partition protein